MAEKAVPQRKNHDRAMKQKHHDLLHGIVPHHSWTVRTHMPDFVANACVVLFGHSVILFLCLAHCIYEPLRPPLINTKQFTSIFPAVQ